jgi:hypothetical protein
VRIKAPNLETHQARVQKVLAAFFQRQGVSVLGTGRFNKPMWDKDLTGDLHASAVAVSTIVGKSTMRDLGFNPAVYDVARTVEFLRAVSARMAGNVNATTQAQLKDADDPAMVFAIAQNSRSEGIAGQVTTMAAGFAVVEAGRHAGEESGQAPTKTWVTGVNPRPEHAALDGETVGIDDTFSNGAQWTGDDGEPGCNCSIEVEF